MIVKKQPPFLWVDNVTNKLYPMLKGSYTTLVLKLHPEPHCTSIFIPINITAWTTTKMFIAIYQGNHSVMSLYDVMQTQFQFWLTELYHITPFLQGLLPLTNKHKLLPLLRLWISRRKLARQNHIFSSEDHLGEELLFIIIL